MEIGIVLIIALLVFGPKRLPELGGSLGKGIREFSRSVTGHSEEKPALSEGEAVAEATKPPAVAER
jgi:sec-independent protein translocase protein TatA